MIMMLLSVTLVRNGTTPTTVGCADVYNNMASSNILFLCDKCRSVELVPTLPQFPPLPPHSQDIAQLVVTVQTLAKSVEVLHEDIKPLISSRQCTPSNRT